MKFRKVHKYNFLNHLKLRLKVLFFNHKTKSKNVVYPNVLWLSHHIPKTAGTSLNHSLNQAFGKQNIWRVYEEFNLAVSLSLGNPIYVPQYATVVHGHFRPHQHQEKMFPNAQHIIWIRDPLNTAWSLFRHALIHQLYPKYAAFGTTFNTMDMKELEEVFERFLSDTQLLHVSRPYSIYLAQYTKAEFAFVGQMENYDGDLKKLSKIIGQELIHYQENVNTENKKFPFDKAKFKAILQSEYNFLNTWLGAEIYV